VASSEITGLDGNLQEKGNANNSNGEKKRSHKKYLPSINKDALQALEGTTTSSFVDLAQAVILIDGVPYDKETLPMSKARKMDFERLIAHYAKLEIYGRRKYHVKSVINRVTKDELNDVELKIMRKAPYTKTKPLTEAQKAARREIYEAKKEQAKKEAEKHAEKVKEQAKQKIAELQKTT